jgi:hypothetical protein
MNAIIRSDVLYGIGLAESASSALPCFAIKSFLRAAPAFFFSGGRPSGKNWHGEVPAQTTIVVEVEDA